jgi:predicted RNase H-like HicB family nuclease
MQYQVFVQHHANNGYIAAVLGLPECLAEGKTKEEAVANAKATLQSHLTQGEVVTIEVEGLAKPDTGNPWLDTFGVFKEDSTFDDFLEKVADERRKADEQEANL